MCYVDDIIGCFRQDIDKRRFPDAMTEFKTGDAEELTIHHPVTFLGLDLRRISPVEIELSQQTFVQRMPEAKLEDIIMKGRRIVSLDKIRSFSKSHLGNMIWILQTRYDLAFSIIDLATTVMHVLEDANELTRMVRLVNEIPKKAKERHVGMVYGPVSGFSTRLALDQWVNLRTFGFCDAVYCALLEKRALNPA